MAVCAGNNGGIVGALGPALDLQAAEARLRQIVQVIDHAHIPGVHDIGPRPVPGQYYENARYIREWQVVALVTECAPDGTATLTLRNKFREPHPAKRDRRDVPPRHRRGHGGMRR